MCEEKICKDEDFDIAEEDFDVPEEDFEARWLTAKEIYQELYLAMVFGTLSGLLLSSVLLFFR